MNLSDDPVNLAAYVSKAADLTSEEEAQENEQSILFVLEHIREEHTDLSEDSDCVANPLTACSLAQVAMHAQSKLEAAAAAVILERVERERREKKVMASLFGALTGSPSGQATGMEPTNRKPL